MCLPAAGMMIAATALSAVGAGVGALSAHSQAQYQSKLSEVNARAAGAQANDANERGKLDLQAQMRRNAQLAGEQRLAMAANGIESDFGSAFDLQRDTAMLAAEEYSTIQRNTEREMAGYDTQGANYRAEAKAAKQAGKAALVKGVFDMGTTILGGAQQVNKIKLAQAGKI